MYRDRERPDMNGDQPAPGSHVEVAIVGAGFSGLGMAMALKESGIEDFFVFERAGDLGGTWRDNTYPGCACDIPSVLYSWSAEQNPSWSRAFAGQQEIWDYMREVVSRHDLARHIHLNHEVTRMRWDEERSVWEIETNQGAVTADVAVAAGGAVAGAGTPHAP